MDFYEVLDQIIDLLRQRGRVSYQALKRQFDVDDAYLDDLKVELIEVQELATDRDGKMLVWSGEAVRTPESTPAPATPERVSPAITAHAGPPIAYIPPYLAEKILTSRSALEGERKQVTVLFADIKDSTELIRDLDPEDAQKRLDPAIHIMMEAVHRFEGTVNQVLGDGIMALFGAPIAHEDHALRACYAALAMQGMMRPYADEVLRSRGIAMQIRVGLNSGEVVVRTIGNDLHMDYSAVGPSTHLAARMEQIAMPGSIMLSGSTLRLVEGLVRVHARGPVPVKGMTEPVEVYELIGASGIRRRLQAAVARGLTKFIGRDTEIEALNQALEHAGTGHGQIVVAVGEAGVGKSRLVYEFVHSHRTQGWLVLESASVSYGKATPYFPVIDLLKRYVHVEEGDEPRTVRAKVTGHILTLDESLQETIPALLSLLDALPEDNLFLQLDPPQRRQRILDGLKRILLRESQVQPLLLVFEDLHWIDSETQALLDSLVESLPTAQILLLLNYRREYQHGWGSKTFYTQLRLDPLPPENADEFLGALLGGDLSLDTLKKLLIERTEGNPFFLEESVRTLIETEVLVGEPGAYRLAQDLPTIQIPATVQAILAARIDRLPEDEKRLLQTAAVIGNEVPLSLLQAIAELPEEVLHRCLTHLQAAEFLYETSLFPERVYTFKHALTHEVAYGGLLQERRRGLHARIMDAMETLYAGRLAEQVERLAHHALRGGVWEKALMYCRQAGYKAQDRSVHREAVTHFEHALEVLTHLSESRQTSEQAIDIRLDLRTSFLPLGEHQRISQTLQEAAAVAEALDDQQRLAWIASGFTHYFWLVGEHERALAHGQRAQNYTASLSDDQLHLRVNYHLAQVYDSLGDYEQAIELLQWNVASPVTETLSANIHDPAIPAVVFRSRLVMSLAEAGLFAEGITRGEEAIRLAEEADHPYSRSTAYGAVSHLYRRKGEFQKAIGLLDRSLEVCQAWDIRQMFAGHVLNRSYALALSGEMADALAILEQYRAPTHDRPPIRMREIAELFLVADCVDEARLLAERALERANKRKERGHQAWVLRLLGDIAMHHNPPDTEQAETHYRQALSLANELGMRPLQAHCHRGLGTLYRQTGQPEQARAELSTAIEMYREMEMMFWLPQAETALTPVE